MYKQLDQNFSKGGFEVWSALKNGVGGTGGGGGGL